MSTGLPEQETPPAPAATLLQQPTAENPALEMRDVWFAYGSRPPALQGVSLGAPPGRITMILGVSGGGKTTLLKLAKGLLPSQRGDITVLGKPLEPGARRLNPLVAYIPQQLGLARNLTVTDNTLTGALGRMGAIPSLLKIFPAAERSWDAETLSSLGLAHKTDEKVYALSGGERQRVAIARALMQRPRLILADEFISQLDAATSAEIMEAMRDTVRRGVALVMTTHSLETAVTYADRIIILRDGRKALDCEGRGASAAELSRHLKA